MSKTVFLNVNTEFGVQYYVKGLFVSYLCLLNALSQRSPDSVLEGQCPAVYFQLASTHLPGSF